MIVVEAPVRAPARPRSTRTVIGLLALLGHHRIPYGLANNVCRFQRPPSYHHSGGLQAGLLAAQNARGPAGVASPLVMKACGADHVLMAGTPGGAIFRPSSSGKAARRFDLLDFVSSIPRSARLTNAPCVTLFGGRFPASRRATIGRQTRRRSMQVLSLRRAASGIFQLLNCKPPAERLAAP
jgi:hypothetical protein